MMNSSSDVEAGPNSKVVTEDTEGEVSDSLTVKDPPPGQVVNDGAAPSVETRHKDPAPPVAVYAIVPLASVLYATPFAAGVPELTTTEVLALPMVMVLVPPVPMPIFWLMASLPILMAPAEELISRAAEESRSNPPAEEVRAIASAPIPAEVNKREASNAPTWEIVKSSDAPLAVLVMAKVELAASMSIPPAVASMSTAAAPVPFEVR
jgi:hypothetical protein